MLKLSIPAMLLLAIVGGAAPASAGDPTEVVEGIYASHPWTSLPPGGHGAWYWEIASAWGKGAADAGMAFLVGTTGKFTTVDTEVGETGGDEARVRATLSGKDGTVYALNFGMIRDDDEDDRWRVIEVFTDDGKYLSEILANQ